ncbi:MAG: tRNA (adenosine(37)-N6)-dimethylallyltransferase MiaA [Bacteroidales bacterium]|nr:MAG: tRNA (adenosine(37)-N6)-dimethylallyltransferase MiaA [Bacteroidales bacterium]
MSSKYDLITIIGPTASGKTQLAAHVAKILKGEIISGDSRQVYRGMNLGTGKDLGDYTIDNVSIPYHLIDIVDAGSKYNVYEFQKDFFRVYDDIKAREKQPILCGGSGLYIESVIKEYRLIAVPDNIELRNGFKGKTDEELIKRLSSYKNLHNQTDTTNRKRLERAIEIEEYYLNNDVDTTPLPKINNIIFGVRYSRNSERNRISCRLKQRLKDGMVDEVKALLNSGVSADDLIYYGLEYKFITQHILGQITWDEMFTQLNNAIAQFAKRQMTWFRRMERNGIDIKWIQGNLPIAEKVNIVLEMIK